MKSTYKLLGVIYDGLPEARGNYIISSCNNTILDITEEKCLFDIEEYIRKIQLSFLLSIEKQEELDLILETVGRLDKIILVLDVIGNNPIIKTFIDKRTKQILWLLENKCNHIILSIS